jgi:hypothetical protein
MRVLGALVFAGGLFLFIGNVSGAYRTFPGLGWLTMAIGGIMFRAGGADLYGFAR